MTGHTIFGNAVEYRPRWWFDRRPWIETFTFVCGRPLRYRPNEIRKESTRSGTHSL